MKNGENNFIKKSATNYLKGIAIIFMFIHHFFTFPSWYINNISFTNHFYFLDWFQQPSKICLCIFSFLTGYFYFYNNNKTIFYSLKKILSIWLKYLAFLIPILIIVIILNYNNYSLKYFFYDFFSYDSKTMIFCSYIPFYSFSLIYIFFLSKIERKLPSYILFFLFFLPKLLCLYIFHFYSMTSYYLLFLPCIGIGYITAKYRIFYIIDNFFNFNKKLLNIIIGLIFLLLPLIILYYFKLFSICSLLFVYGSLKIFYTVNNKLFFNPILVMGKYSISMWFIHCIFFNQLKIYTQPILFFSKNQFLVLIWGLFICFIISYLLEKLFKIMKDSKLNVAYKHDRSIEMLENNCSIQEIVEEAKLTIEEVN